MIYLDHSATTPVDPAVLEAMAPYWSDRFGNPASGHAPGAAAAGGVARARAQIARLLGATAAEIVLTSGGTESDNLAVQGVARAAGGRGRILVSAVEHPAVRESARVAVGEGTEEIPVDREGLVDLEALAKMLAAGERPILVSVMHASNEVGTVQPVAAIGRMCRERGVPFHVDAVQTVAQLPFDVATMGCDLVTVTAHKIYGPKGAGALYVRGGTPLDAILVGGSQEGGLRGGTLNVTGTVGLGAACELAARRLDEAPRLAALRTRLLDGMRERLDEVLVLGSETDRLPGHLSVAVPGVDSRSLVVHLDAMGIAASRGSACASGTDAPSPTLHAMGYDSRIARGALRLTLGHGSTEAEIDQVVELLPSAVAASAK